MAKDKDELPPDSLHGPLNESELHGHEAAKRMIDRALRANRSEPDREEHKTKRQSRRKHH